MVEEAQETYIRLLRIDYYDDTNHSFYASFLSDTGKYEEAYREYEIAAKLDLNDPNRFLSLAIEILNNRFVRRDETTVSKLSMGENVFLYVMPIFQYTLQISNNSNPIRTRIANILMKRNQQQYAKEILNFNTCCDQEMFISFPLDYVLEADIEHLREDMENEAMELSSK